MLYSFQIITHGFTRILEKTEQKRQSIMDTKHRTEETIKNGHKKHNIQDQYYQI
jgi:hypothetical protein